MEKQWKKYVDLCPACGGDPEVLTESKEPDWALGDQARCIECGLCGIVEVYKSISWIAWNEIDAINQPPATV